MVRRDADTALLLQPEVGEGAVAYEVDDEPRHLARADLKQVCTGRASGHGLNAYAAGLTTRARTHKDKDAFAVEFAELLDFDLPVSPRREHVAPCSRHLAPPDPASRSRPVGNSELYIG